MAKQVIRVSDKSGQTIEENQGATVRIIYDDARRGTYELDVTSEEAAQYAEGARKIARRGRRPKSEVSAV
jgi:hypothetical protein